MTRARAHRVAVAAAALFVSSAPRSTRAAGFLIYEQGTSALSQGGAFVARADDPSAIFYNPAGLAAFPRLGALVGGTAIISSTTAKVPSLVPAHSKTQLHLPPTLYLAVPLGRRVAVGVGTFTQYGLGIEWPAAWAGQYRVLSVSARSITVNPTLAVRVLPRLSLGAGFDVVFATFDLKRAVNLVHADGLLHLGGTSTAYGANAGLLFEAVPDRLRIGLSYRSATDLAVTGDADFTVPIEWSAKLKDQRAQARIETPHLLAAAGSVRVAEDIWLSLDLIYATWSSLQHLTFEFPDDPSLSSTEPQDWSDTLAVRAGGEAGLGSWRLRAGFGLESAPVPAATLSPLVPDAPRLLLSAGFAYDFGPVRAELGYMAAVFAGRHSRLPNFQAHYDSQGHLVGASLQYRH